MAFITIYYVYNIIISAKRTYVTAYVICPVLTIVLCGIAKRNGDVQHRHIVANIVGVKTTVDLYTIFHIGTQHYAIII